MPTEIYQSPFFFSSFLFFCILAWLLHPQEKLLRKSSQSFVWSLHEALLSLKLLKATDPLHSDLWQGPFFTVMKDEENVHNVLH